MLLRKTTFRVMFAININPFLKMKVILIYILQQEYNIRPG